MKEHTDLCILISAGAEWRGLLPHFPGVEIHQSPYGEFFIETVANREVCFMHGGSGKVAAAGSTQYAIDRWNPRGIINIGTCGGFQGRVDQGDVILAKKTIIYDIYEQMSDPDQAIKAYSTLLDLSWLPEPPPQPVRVEILLSADRDINPEEIPFLIEKYDARAADWESGAIAWIAQRNKLPCLILRGVSDLVGAGIASAYGDYGYFEAQSKTIMANFAHHLPGWIDTFQKRL